MKKTKELKQKIYKCLNCQKVQIYKNSKPFPENIKFVELETCLHCDKIRNVNIFKQFIFN